MALEMDNPLPLGWTWTTLGEIVDVIRGVSFPKDAKRELHSNGLVACLRTTNVQKEVEWDDLWFIDKGYVRRDEQFIQQNDILISTANSLELLGKVALVKEIPFKATLGTFIVNLRSSILNPRFVYYSLASKQFQQQVQDRASTTTNISNISTGKLKEIPAKVPPLPEQHRIVEKIETLFSELDNGSQQLKTAQQQLKIYRQSVLKWAFEGKLTAEWRRSRPESALADEGPDNTLPAGWRWVKLGDVCSGVEYGSAAKSKEKGKIPVLRMGNIQNGRFDWEDLVFTDDEDEIKKYFLKTNDVLFNRTNSAELVGKTAIYKGERPAIFAGYLIRINRIESLIDANYLTYFLNSQFAKNYGDTVKSFGVNQSNINGTKLKGYPLPLAPLDQQLQIVQEIESRLSVCDKLEETITASLRQAEALRQSILKKAFEGKLVPQDPNDEPASALLERIKNNNKD